MTDIYADARAHLEALDEVETRFKILEIFTTTSVFHLTNQTEPSNVQQLAILYRGFADRAKIKFTRSLNSAIKSCNPDTTDDFMATVEDLTTLATEIGAYECIPAIDDILLNFADPLNPKHIEPLRSILPDFASLSIGSPDAHLPFRRLADSTHWNKFLPTLMSACCFLDKSKAAFYLNEYLPVVHANSLVFDLRDLLLEIEASAGVGVMFGQLQGLEAVVLEEVVEALFGGEDPPYSVQVGTDPKSVNFQLNDRPGFLAIPSSWHASENFKEFHVPCEDSPELFILLSNRFDAPLQKASADIVTIDFQSRSNGTRQ